MADMPEVLRKAAEYHDELADVHAQTSHVLPEGVQSYVQTSVETAIAATLRQVAVLLEESTDG